MGNFFGTKVVSPELQKVCVLAVPGDAFQVFFQGGPCEAEADAGRRVQKSLLYT